MSGPDFNANDFDDAGALALDFALGALDRDARAAAERRLASDPAFRAEVEGYARLLSPLDDATAPVAPPPHVWEKIAMTIAPAPTQRTPAPLSPERQGWFASLNLWRGLAGASTALAIGAVAMLMLRPAPPAQPLLVATLASSSGAALLTATYDAARGAVILTPAGKEDVAGRTPELWVIEGDNPPRSLGLIDISTPGSHAIPADRLKGLKPGSTLAISLEPAGGSKTGAPTGPVVATGKLTGI